MNHGDMNHGDMDMSECSMTMFLNTDTSNLCILIKQWRVTGFWSLFQSLIVIVLFGMSFEAIRALTRRYEQGSGGTIALLSTTRPGSPSSSSSSSLSNSKKAQRKRQVVKSLLYALQVGISFLLMLVFMTYNVYVMGAVVVGSGVGYYLFNSDPNGVSGKGMACH